MKRALILVEGQTEEEVVKRLLQPHLAASLWMTPTIIVTKRVKDGPRFKGGIRSYGQIERDLRRLLYDADAALVTTLIDYYGLPADVPGMATRPPGSAEQRVAHVERAVADAFHDPRFRPFFALHELEAWLFSDLDRSAAAYPPGSDLATLRQIRTNAAPEAINENYATAPSRRVLAACPGYRKPLHGPLALEAIGIDGIRAQCPHFDAWLRALEAA